MKNFKKNKASIAIYTLFFSFIIVYITFFLIYPYATLTLSNKKINSSMYRFQRSFATIYNSTSALPQATREQEMKDRFDTFLADDFGLSANIEVVNDIVRDLPRVEITATDYCMVSEFKVTVPFPNEYFTFKKSLCRPF